MILSQKLRSDGRRTTVLGQVSHEHSVPVSTFRECTGTTNTCSRRFSWLVVSVDVVDCLKSVITLRMAAVLPEA